MERLVCLLIGYACGLFQTAYLLGRLCHIDIREKGSGNVGTTNALRVLGWKAGLITFLCDVLKCIAAIIITRVIFRNSAYLPLLAMYAGVGVTLGHNFPFYMKFKGGKGIAVLAGLIAVTMVYTSLWVGMIPLVIFVTAVVLTRYISVGSLQVSAMFLMVVIFYGQLGDFGMEKQYLYELYGLVFFLTVLAWYRHRENIRRLINGTENRFGSKAKR